MIGRRPQLAEWFNAEVASGTILVCDLVVGELEHQWLLPRGTL